MHYYFLYNNHSLILSLTEYIDELIQETIHQCEIGGCIITQKTPPPLCSSFERPDKKQAVKAHKSRFIPTHQ